MGRPVPTADWLRVHGGPPPRQGPLSLPACSLCGDSETVEQLFCACPGLVQERSRVTTAYRRQDLLASTVKHFLFPSPPHLPALRSLAEFLGETGNTAYR
ncbi:hypothetical protein HPB52_023329 [Rhipicephalus sanguineus]|uniref:Tick transposon n=1 Tax=Rhipicephalus sanguineus TaxID=34632 RepID=A0A9D4QCD8_RHISA|nr:hypothetical protein HPB52_023329 [Rhipicephalus sanguineus]